MIALLLVIIALQITLLMAIKPHLFSANRPLKTEKNEQMEPIEAQIVDSEIDIEPTILALGEMTVTIYHAVPGQTDDSPMITASNYNLEGKDIEEIRVCALSRDLLSRWGGPINYGDHIYIDLPDKDLTGWWTVEDTMAKRWTNHIDLLVPTTRKGGKWTDVEAWTPTN